MNWPNWMKDHVWQWLAGIIFSIIGIIVSIVLFFFSSSTPTAQVSSINGNENIQIVNSPGATVTISKIDPEELAEKLVKKYEKKYEKQFQQLRNAVDEVQQLKATIENLQKDKANELKQAALIALNDGDTTRTIDLLEESALSREEEAEQLIKLAVQDWFGIGNIAYLNDPQRALNAYNKVVKLDPLNAEAWNRLGNTLYRLDNLDEAQQAYEQILKLSESDKSFQSAALFNLGSIYQARGELDKSVLFYEKTLIIDHLLGNQKNESSVYGNLGIIYGIRGELHKAEGFSLEALRINKAIGNKEGMAINYGNLGIIYQIWRKLDKAEELHMKAFEINKALERQQGMANQYGSLGIIYETQGKLNKAEEYYLKALEINKALGSQKGIAKCYGNLGNTNRICGELDKAEEYYLKALEINKTIGLQEGIANQYGNLGFIYKTRGNIVKACDYWNKCLELFIQIGAKGQIRKTNNIIADNCGK